MLKMSRNAMLFNGAALLVVAASAIAVVRSALFHDDSPPCLDRYAKGTSLALERSGQPLTIEDLQSRAGGTDWSLLSGARVQRLKSGPAKAAIEFDLAAAAAANKDNKDVKPGVGFVWTPRNDERMGAACLSYSVFLPEDFEFGRGGVLPGLVGAYVEESGEPKAPPFSARYAWRQDGSGDIHTHLPGWAPGRSMGNDRRGFKFEKGKWINLEQEVVLNVPGQKNGLMRIWVDGVLRYEKSGLVFRDSSAGTEAAGLAGVLAEVSMADAPGPKQKVWVTGFEMRWR